MINLALIGVGEWGKNYLRAVKKVPDVSIKYVCSGPTSMRDISPEYIKIYNYKEIVQKEDVDGVIIAAPSQYHYKLTEFFLSAKKPILVEKPLTTSLAEANKLKKIFDTISGKLMVGNIFLYNDAFRAFSLLSKKIGKISYIHAEGCDNGPIRNEVSALWDWSPHDIAMCIDLMGRPEAVCGWSVTALRPNTKYHDMIYTRLFFNENVSAFLRMGWLSPIKKREMLIVGEDGSLLFDDTSDKKIIFFDKTGKKKTIECSQNEPLVNQLTDFVKMIENNKIPVGDFRKNFLITEVIDAIDRSINANGKVIKI